MKLFGFRSIELELRKGINDGWKLAGFKKTKKASDAVVASSNKGTIYCCCFTAIICAMPYKTIAVK